jgi:hypothetical protein
MAMPTDDEIKAALDCIGSMDPVELRRRVLKSHNGLFEKLVKAACVDPDEKIELGEPDKINKESARRLWEASRKVKDLSAGVDLTDDVEAEGMSPDINLEED